MKCLNYRICLISSFFCLCLQLFFTFALPQQGSAQDDIANRKVFGPEAIWSPSEAVIRKIGESCEHGGECFIKKMIEAGAPPSSV